jgi:hypothetical protein
MSHRTRRELCRLLALIARDYYLRATVPQKTTDLKVAA